MPSQLIEEIFSRGQPSKQPITGQEEECELKEKNM